MKTTASNERKLLRNSRKSFRLVEESVPNKEGQVQLARSDIFTDVGTAEK